MQADEATGAAASKPIPAAPNSDRAAGYDDVSAQARSSRRGSENRARSQLLNVRINEDERERWTAFAQSKGLPLAGLLRLSVEAAILQDEIAEAMR